MTALQRVWPGVALTALSLLLFAYVGYGEAMRVYLQIRIERIEQLGATLQGTVGQFAKSGLPLDQFGGFDRRSQQLRVVDPAILATSLVDVDGKPIFCEAEPAHRDTLCRAEASTDSTHARWMATPLRGGPGVDLAVSLPVSDKFANVGRVLLHLDRDKIERVVDAAFRPVFAASAGLFVLFCIAQLILRSWQGEAVRQRWLTPLFLTVIALNLAVMVVIMFDLYRKGTEGQAEALARSMAARLSAVTDLGIPLSALSGIHEAFNEYRQINPNIAAISLNDRNRVLYSVQDQANGAEVFGMPLQRLVFDLPVEKSPEHDLVLSVELPLSVVLAALGAGARNFLALFFGCAVLALVFLRAVREGQGAISGDAASRLALLRPAYFLGIFADALSLSILPEISKETVLAEGLSTEWVSLPFTLFFVGLTAALLPASYVTGRVEIRRLFMAGAGAVGIGLFLASLVPDFWALCVGRMLSGIGQGTLLVAVQAYAFEVVGEGQRTRAAAVQVLGYNGGLIVGTGLGGLLAVFNADRDVLLVGGLVAVGACIYIRFVLPALVHHETAQAAPVSLLGSIGRLARAPDFMAVLGLVGITSKFALAGIAMFAMPLVLHQAGYGDDEVGQALMVFAVVTYLVTGVAPRLVGRVGSIDGVLTIGMIMLAVGIGLLGLLVVPAGGASAPPAFVPGWLLSTASQLQAAVGSSALPIATGLAVMVAIAALGVGQGLIAAPVVARVADSRVADTVGRERTLAIYRLAERAGHILGPTLVGPVLLAAHGDAIPLAIFAIVFAGLAVVYGLWSVLGRSQAA
ncbi:MAG: MFS transporter [Thalassobaculum sp.]|uniref:MFS transporter n=1 Tax=Thalassobaculum sp. TaxID=2022740 RepID=UPI0032ECC34A